MASIQGLNANIGTLKPDPIERISQMHLSTSCKCQLIQYAKAKDFDKKIDIYEDIVFSLFNSLEIMKLTSKDINLKQWKTDVERLIVPSITEFNDIARSLVLLSLSKKFASLDHTFAPVFIEMSRFVETEWEKIR